MVVALALLHTFFQKNILKIIVSLISSQAKRGNMHLEARSDTKGYDAGYDALRIVLAEPMTQFASFITFFLPIFAY